MKREELQEVLRKHKLWLDDEEGGELANLRLMDLSDADLRRANLRHANLRHADLSDADLRHADLSDADLRHADLRRADLSDADLRHADLRYADLRYADLRRADLSDADIDYSCWPLWCGSLDVKVDARIARQLAYHFCRLDCDDPEYIAARNAIVGFANGFHRVKECGELEIK